MRLVALFVFCLLAMSLNALRLNSHDGITKCQSEFEKYLGWHLAKESNPKAAIRSKKAAASNWAIFAKCVEMPEGINLVKYQLFKKLGPSASRIVF